MADRKTCPQCGAPLTAESAEGLCRACLLKLALEAKSVLATAAEVVAGWTPPEPAELTAKFPDLDFLELIGRGGMGAVYKARQKDLDRLVAVKILPPSIGADPSFADRFAREAKALAKLDHPNIVTIHAFGQAAGLFFFIMHYVEGVNLRQLLDAGRMSPREALAIVPQICDALQYAHDHGIVHRDIKPENILMNRRGQVTVADFGIAKIMERDLPALQTAVGAASGSAHTTETDRVMGTPQYMAPEQVEHPADVDHRADIYSLGVVFYQMLTGELPSKRIEPPSTKVVIDVRLDEVVLRALEKDPRRRYQQVSEVKTQVETIAGQPRHADAPPRGTLPALLKVSSRSYYTTPEYLATFVGGFWWPRQAGELALYEDRLVLSSGWQRTEILFVALVEVGVARCPRWMSPAGHQLLSLTYAEQGQRKTLLVMPGDGWFRTASDTKQRAAEWIVAICQAVKSTIGKDLSGHTNVPKVVPASPWASVLVLTPLLLVLVLSVWQMIAVSGRAFMPVQLGPPPTVPTPAIPPPQSAAAPHQETPNAAPHVSTNSAKG